MTDVESPTRSSRPRGFSLFPRRGRERRTNKEDHQHSTSRSLTSTSIESGSTIGGNHDNSISIAKIATSTTSPVGRTGGNSPSGPPAQADPIVILLLGLTGAGKSSFIARLTKDSSGVGMGLNSETQTIVEHEVWVKKRKYIFIDTPGFNDSGSRSDFNVLRNICSALQSTDHETQISRKISGVLYLHRITDERMRASSTKVLQYLQELCGSSFMPNVVLLSTHWDLLTGKEDLKKANARHDELQGTFWKAMMTDGARPVTFNPAKDNAEHLISRYFSRGSSELTKVQKELEHFKGQFHHTTVGKLAQQLNDPSPVLSKRISSPNVLSKPPTRDEISPINQLSVPPRTDSACALNLENGYASYRSSSLAVQYTPPDQSCRASETTLQLNTSQENLESKGSNNISPAFHLQPHFKNIPSEEFSPPPSKVHIDPDPGFSAHDPTVTAIHQSRSLPDIISRAATVEDLVIQTNHLRSETMPQGFVSREKSIEQKPSTLQENIALQKQFTEWQKRLDREERKLVQQEWGLLARRRELIDEGPGKSYPSLGLNGSKFEESGTLPERDDLVAKELSLLENDWKSLRIDRELLAMQREVLERKWEPLKRYLEPSVWTHLG